MKNTLIILMLFTLNACMLAVAGGAGAGGYYAGKDERSVVTIANDAATTGLIKTKFLADDMVSAMDINIDTYDGNVTLTGAVPNGQTGRRAEEIARSVKGVKSVTLDLEVVR